MMKLILYIWIALSVVFLASSCSGTKGLTPDQKLFTGTDINIIDNENLSNKPGFYKKTRLELPKKNTPGLLNIKTGLYNIYQDAGKSGWKKAIKNRLGSKPVIYNSQTFETTQSALQKILYDNGYFDGTISCDTLHKKRKVSISCDVTLNQRYIVDSIYYLVDTLQISKVMRPLYDIKYLTTNKAYDQSNIVKERESFTEAANNNGYPYFVRNDMLFYIDTSFNDKKVNIHVTLRPTNDSLKYQRFRIGKIYVNPSFDLENDEVLDTANMTRKDGYYLANGYTFLNDKALDEAIYINEGNIYNKRSGKITTDRLLDFGLFKFVNVKTVNQPGFSLDHFINLTTYKMQSISGEIELNNRSGNFFGLGGKTTYSNKNIFGGAERFDLTLSGGLETQFQSSQSLLNTSEIRLEGSLTFPKVVMPFFTFKTNKYFIPKTFMSLSIGQERRVGFYTARSAQAKYGFKWNETEYKTSALTPLDLTWIFLDDVSPAFQEVFDASPRLQQSLGSTLILGSSYSYTYNRKSQYNDVDQSYFKGTIESAGALLNLLTNDLPNDQSVNIFKTPFAQYLRIITDARKYWKASSGAIATRLYVGVGHGYGNSNELPYSKQFSIGGANSLRAFRLRSLGPGTYEATTTGGGSNQFIDQTGDIKIEASIEYRFPILEYFKGAIFLDAGNIWLTDGSEIPEGLFQFDKFYNQIAVGTGIGFRFDFEFLVLRFDLAIPLRKLNNNSSFTWTFGDIDFLDSAWRGDNLLLNLGFGYPF